MSMARVCDCDCHDDGYVIDDTLDSFATFADRDVCTSCLNYCERWNAYAGPREQTAMEKSIAAVWTPYLTASLGRRR